MKTLAIDIGGTKFTVAGFDGERMTRRESRATDRAGGREKLMESLTPLLREWHAAERFDRCGIGFGGPVYWPSQKVALSTHVGGWSEFDLPGHIRELLDGAPVVMDNDANAGALGEYRHGAGKGCSPLFYMTVSTGIGGGVLIDGQVLRGPDSWAGEIGHLNVLPDGPGCLCGSNGCLEHHAAESGADRDRRRDQQGGRCAVRAAARGTGATDAAVVAGPGGRAARAAGRR